MARPNSEDDPFPKNWNRSDSQAWFERRLIGRRSSDIRVLVARAALRSLPRLLPDLEKFGVEGAITFERMLLACLRNYPILYGAAHVPLKAEAHFRFSANSAYADANFAAVANVSAVAQAATTPGADRVKASVSIVNAAIAMFGARGGTGPGGFLQSFIAAFEQDILTVEASGPANLAAEKLWPYHSNPVRKKYEQALFFRTMDVWGGVPFDFRGSIGVFHDFLRKLPGDFAIWAEWYQGVLEGQQNGRHFFGLPTERAMRLNVDFALIDDALWKGDPALLHAEMRRLIEVAREEGQQSAVDLGDLASPQPILNAKGKMDIAPAPEGARAIVDDELRALPDRQLAIIRTLFQRLPKQGFDGLFSLLTDYENEMKHRSLAPNLGLLSDCVSIMACDFAALAREGWKDPGGLLAKVSFEANHRLIIAHFPLAEKREAQRQALELNEERLDETELQKAIREVEGAIRSLKALDRTEAAFEAGANAVIRNANAALDIRPALGSREAGAVRSEGSHVKAKALANLGGFSKRAGEEVAKATIAEAAKGPILQAFGRLWELILSAIS